MSYVCLATASFDAVEGFYRQVLGGSVIRAWDRPGARGVLLEVHGLRLELLDASREKRQLRLLAPGDRVHLVLEVLDVDAVHQALALYAPVPVTTNWGCRCFAIRDPDGVQVTFLQWLREPDAQA
jgi:catechol 2,3-dioxygenase-like lactoylglutathione lyase family enzyme